MSILPQLERDLLEAANRRLCASGDSGAGPSGSRLGVRGRARRLRLPILALGCLLVTTTIALAATGVILTGEPVRPEELLNPSVGEGVPAPGASQLLALRVPDPEGGLPWGMRIVRTTRGEVCLQIGRVQDGQLGELGIDGAFHGDGRFHPIPADARCPPTSFTGASSTPSWRARPQAASSPARPSLASTSALTAALAQQTDTARRAQGAACATSTTGSSGRVP
jgi:hypothetical protein